MHSPKKQKSILYICRRFNPDKWGGTETVMIQSALQLQKEGYHVEIFTTLALSNLREEWVQGILIQRFPYILPWFGLSKKAKEAMLLKGGNLFSFSLLWAVLWKRNINLIHLHSSHRIGAIGRFAARLRKIPYVITFHGGWLSIPKEQTDQMTDPFKGKLEWGKVMGFFLGSRHIVRDAQALICVGKDEYNTCKNRFPEKRVLYLPNGVNPAFFSHGNGAQWRMAHNIPSSKKMILCLSRIDYQKNQLSLVEALPDILKNHTETYLVLVGSVSAPAYYDLLIQRIQTLNLTNHVLVIQGVPPQSDNIRDLYAACDIFVLPTRHEPFGIVILEAWAAGKPVVTSAIGGILGFVSPEKDGLFIDPENSGSLVDQIHRILSNHDLARKLGQNGKKKAYQEYDWRIIAKPLISLYNELLELND